MLALTLRWRMRRSVKKRSINVATLQAGFIVSPPPPIETPRRFFHQLRAGREIPIGVADTGVAEVGGERRKLLLYLLALAMPLEQRPDGEAVPEVVHARPGMIAGTSQPDLSGQAPEE